MSETARDESPQIRSGTIDPRPIAGGGLGGGVGLIYDHGGYGSPSRYLVGWWGV